jgi:outer membrane protein assembly complex protein YaeT
LQLRAGLLRTLTALALTAAAVCAVPRSAYGKLPQSSAESSSTYYEGIKVDEVVFPNVKEEKEQTRLRALLSQRAGEALSREHVRESIKALYATGRFADIRAEATRSPSQGVVLSFVTDPNYFVGIVSLDMELNRPTPGQIINASKLQLGELFTSEKLDLGLKNIKQLMQEHGFYRHSVTYYLRRIPERQQVDVTLHVNPGPQARVGQVTVTGGEKYSQGQIQDIARLHPGDLVSAQRVSDALDRVRKKYQKQDHWLAQVAIPDRTYHSETNTVDYQLQVTPGPVVEIVAEGFKLSRGVIKRNVPVYEENALDDDLLNEGRRNLLNYLQSRGYFEAKVTLRRRRANEGKNLRVIYVIEAGDRHRLVNIKITGNKYFAEELLRSHMQVQTASRFFSQGHYSPRLLADDVGGLEDLYRANGFREVKITSQIADDYEGQENQLAVALQVEEGPQTLVSQLSLSGNKALSEDELRASVNTTAGQPFSEYNVAQDREIVLNQYFNRGFPNASFEATAKPSAEPNRMEVSYAIQEGKQEFVDQVYVSGLNFTRPYVVNRELQVKSGDPVSQIDMLNTQQSLYDLGIFSQVDTAVQNPEGNEPEKNVLVELQESKRYTFNYGLGFEFQTGQPAVGTNQPQGATGVSPRVSFDVTRLNFGGRDHTVAFKTHVGRLQQRALVSYDAPRWFNTKNLRLSITAFYDNTLDVTTFTSQRLEGSVQIEQILNKASTLTYSMTYRRVQATDIAVSPDQIPLLSQPVRVGIPGFSFIRDKRDNALDSTKGNYTTIDGGVASSYFGSEADFGRLLIQNSTYHAFGKNRPQEKKFVFARSTRIGIESPFADTINVFPGQVIPTGQTLIPLPERFFSGGGNSHRGFGLNQAGPRDPLTGFPLGGSALFVNNLELRLPPMTLPYVGDAVSFAVFHDAGNVFGNGYDLLHNLLRWKQKDAQFCRQESTSAQCDYSYISHAIGVGVHYRTPIGPVRFDFGYNLNPPAFPSVQTTEDPANPGQTISTFVPQRVRHFNVFFSIGQTF